MSEPSALPQIEPVDSPIDFERIAARLQAKIAELPPLDYGALHAELATLAVPSPTVCTLQSLNEDIGKIAEYCDRATEIYLLAHRRSYIIETITDLLTQGWVKFSREKSEGNRTGEAKLKTSQFADLAMDAVVLLKAADKVSRSLEKKHAMLHDQLDCQGRMMRIGEFQRNSSNWNRGLDSAEVTMESERTKTIVDGDGAGDIFDTQATLDRAVEAGEKAGTVV